MNVRSLWPAAATCQGISSRCRVRGRRTGTVGRVPSPRRYRVRFRPGRTRSGCSGTARPALPLGRAPQLPPGRCKRPGCLHQPAQDTTLPGRTGVARARFPASGRCELAPGTERRPGGASVEPPRQVFPESARWGSGCERFRRPESHRSPPLPQQCGAWSPPRRSPPGHERRHPPASTRLPRHRCAGDVDAR